MRALRPNTTGALLASLATFCLTGAPAHAQLRIVEFALTDSTLNSSPVPDFWIASAAPADADGDGDLDILYAGNIDRPDGTGETTVRILLDDGSGGYTPFDVLHEFQSPTEPWRDFSAVIWADYDWDRDLDLLVSGQ